MTAVGVCGFGRCGSTMLMRMLHIGGIRPVDGVGPPAYETPNLDAIKLLPAGALDGHAVKLLDQVLHDGIPDVDGGWKFVWLDRKPTQQARSVVKMMDAMGVDVPVDAVRRLRRSFVDDRPRAIGRLANRGDLCVLSFEDVLADPTAAADELAEFLAPAFDLNVAWAAAEVHDRDPDCLPDLWETRRKAAS